MSDSESPPVFVVPYDEEWPRRFREEQAALTRVLGARVPGPIEHIGSTSVPGLPAKPIIDIMVGVTSLDASRAIIPLLQRLEYLYYPYKADEMHWFCKPSGAFRTHHLHAVPVGTVLFRQRLAFRDYLRAHPEAAAEYARLKLELAERYRLDREAYTDAKWPFVERILTLAQHERGTTA